MSHPTPLKHQRKRTGFGICAAPPLPAWLGYGGLVPFALLALGCAKLPFWHAQLMSALLDYAALILSFIGALHWALAMRAPAEVTLGQTQRLYAWSVLPCLWAWVALQLPAASMLLAIGFIAHWLVDRRLPSVLAAPPWYPQLRCQLTLGAVAALLLVSIV